MAQGYKSGGRKPGTPNNITTEVKEHFGQLLQGNLEGLQKDIDSLEPKDRIKVILAISRFILPTVKAIEIEQIQSNFKPFQVNITRDSKNGND